MSAAIRCDHCSETTGVGSDDSHDWVHVQYGLGRGLRAEADYCTASCAAQGIEKERASNAVLMLSAMDDDEE